VISPIISMVKSHEITYKYSIIAVVVFSFGMLIEGFCSYFSYHL
jgi:hypothetical protein